MKLFDAQRLPRTGVGLSLILAPLVAQLNSLLARVQQALQSQQRFASDAAHELRTPLNAIIGFSDIMKNELFGELGSPRYSEYAKDINDSGAHLLNVIYHGFMDNAQIPAYLAAMDVLLAPPRLVTRSVTGRDMGRWMSPPSAFIVITLLRRGCPGIGDSQRNTNISRVPCAFHLA